MDRVTRSNAGTRPPGRALAAAAALALLAGTGGGCANGPRIGQVRHDNGALAQSGPLVDGLQDGEWTFWYANGTVKAKGSYQRDVRTGTWQHWYENGAPRMRGAYRGERQEDLWEFWYDDGSAQSRGEYRDGREHGEWSFWRRGGGLQQRGVLWRGRRELEWTEYDADGRATRTGSWFADQPVGTFRITAADGSASTVTYAMPAGVEHVLERWDDGSVRREGFRRDGVATGVWVTRHRGGALRAVVEFVAGRPDGELVCRSAEGALLARGPLLDGCPAGAWRVAHAGSEATVAVTKEPRAPWDRQWSDAALAEREPPLAVVGRWLDELCAPGAVEPQPEPTPRAAPVPERPEAPTDPGDWTVRERKDLDVMRRYYRDGMLLRNLSLENAYNLDDDTRLGSGDAALAAAITGKPLPVTRFPTADGVGLDLASLRGKRVLLVMLRGFTSQVCVYCFTQTAELAPLADRLAALDCEVVVLFPGRRSRLQAFTSACAAEFKDRAPPFHWVFDPDLELAQALGLKGNLARPAALLLDRQGIVRTAYVAENERNIADRPSAQDLLHWVERLR